MTFIDGATSPLAANVEGYVTVESRRATWGNRMKLMGGWLAPLPSICSPANASS